MPLLYMQSAKIADKKLWLLEIEGIEYNFMIIMPLSVMHYLSVIHLLLIILIFS